MMTLRELQKIVKEADQSVRIPTPAKIVNSGAKVVVMEVLTADSDITVYDNGYVVYREFPRVTVFPLHFCKDYCGYVRAGGEKVPVSKDYLENQKWYLRLVMEGMDKIDYSRMKCDTNKGSLGFDEQIDKGENTTVDQVEDFLNSIIRAERMEEIEQLLTEQQMKAVYLYYFKKVSQRKIAVELGISPQCVGKLIKRALAVLKKHADEIF